MKRSINSGMLESLPDALDYSESLMLVIAVDNELHGSLMIFAHRPLLGSERRTLERGGHAAGLLLLQCDVALSRDLQRRAWLLADLVAGGSKWRELRERGNEIGFDVEHPTLVAAFDARPLDCTEFLRKLAHSAAPHSILLDAEQGYVVAILPGYDAVKLNALVTRLGDLLALPVSAGYAQCD